MTCSQIERLESVGKGLQDLRRGLNELRRSQQDQLNLFTQMFDCIAADQNSSAVYPDQDALEEEKEVQVPVKSHKIPHLSGSKKLLIFCNSVKNDGIGFEVYVTNLNLDSIFSSNSPEILIPRIQGEGGKTSGGLETNWAGCVLNSTLYIIKEWVRNCGYDYTADDTKVMKFDLSSSNLNLCGKIGIDLFEPVAYLKYPKHMPKAVPTPDGKKILVFETEISKQPETSFELYDPSENAWTKLEPPVFPTYTCIYVQSYFFIDKSSFVLATTSGYFVLHLDSKKGHLPDLPKLRAGLPCCNMVTIGNLVITAGEASVIGSESESESESESDIVHDFALSFSRVSIGNNDPLPFIALIEHEAEDGDAYTLVAHTSSCEFPEVPGPYVLSVVCHTNLLIDVCRTNLESLHTTVQGTLKYILDPDCSKVIVHLSMFII